MSDVQDFATIENSSGKFEGETGLANWYWQCVMDGDGEEHYPGEWDNEYTGVIYSVFTVGGDEADAFPDEVKLGDTVVIWEDPQGFVTLVAHPTRGRALKFISGRQL
tara:strand:+ start:475 stop:795 length:321 start_codon:yes stop_codon:yes gene_type:complete